MNTINMCCCLLNTENIVKLMSLEGFTVYVRIHLMASKFVQAYNLWSR